MPGMGQGETLAAVVVLGPVTLEIRDNQMTGGFPAWNVALSKKKSRVATEGRDSSN